MAVYIAFEIGTTVLAQHQLSAPNRPNKMISFWYGSIHLLVIVRPLCPRLPADFVAERSQVRHVQRRVRSPVYRLLAKMESSEGYFLFFSHPAASCLRSQIDSAEHGEPAKASAVGQQPAGQSSAKEAPRVRTFNRSKEEYFNLHATSFRFAAGGHHV